MTNKSLFESGFFSRRGLIALLLCAATACSILIGTLPATAGKLAFFRPEAPTQVSSRTLTFEERVAYQRVLEEVYWRHRIWPKERPDLKPSLDVVMSQAQLEKKVEDYLRNSQALEDYWQRPITADQLQAEMDRMAKNTKQPDVLRELFSALGNDPLVIAECLARPALAERLVTNWYAYDQRIHGELRQRARAELQAHDVVDQMKQTSGTYREIELVRSDRTGDQEHCASGRRIKLGGRNWAETVQMVAATFNIRGTAAEGYKTIPVGRLSPLQEDESRYYTTAVVNETKDRLKLATVSWLKESFESWRARTENQMRPVMAAPSGNYTPPRILDGTGGCTNDSWTATAAAPDRRGGHTTVWTGTEMIVWGGQHREMTFSTGGRYNPATDTWIPTTIINAPSARYAHTAVWTGTEMIVWGGIDENFVLFDTGGRYNPVTDSWVATSMTNAPTARCYHTAVWTGSEMIVWGGSVDLGDSNTGGRYNPDTDNWTTTSTANTPAGRSGHTAVWTGGEMIVWGGSDDSSNDLNTGGRYDPGMNSWTATSTANAPIARNAHTAVWADSEMIIFGGYNGSYLNTGGRYNPSGNSWTATSTGNAPVARAYHTAVWSGSEMMIWGGGSSGSDLDSGGRYNPVMNTWTVTSTANAPVARASHTAVWTGSEMIVWGGGGGFDDLNTGGRYNPSMTN